MRTIVKSQHSHDRLYSSAPTKCDWLFWFTIIDLSLFSALFIYDLSMINENESTHGGSLHRHSCLVSLLCEGILLFKPFQCV